MCPITSVLHHRMYRSVMLFVEHCTVRVQEAVFPNTTVNIIEVQASRQFLNNVVIMTDLHK